MWCGAPVGAYGNDRDDTPQLGDLPTTHTNRGRADPKPIPWLRSRSVLYFAPRQLAQLTRPEQPQRPSPTTLAGAWSRSSRVRFLFAIFIFALVAPTTWAQTVNGGPAAPSGVPPRPVVTVNIHGDEVEYDQTTGSLSVSGHARISAATDRPGAPTVALTASGLEGNLQTGRIVASEGVKLLSQQFALRGDRVDLNFVADEFTMEQGAVQVDVPLPGAPGRVLRGFFFGDKVGQSGGVLYVIHGRITTCDRVQPHYSIGSNKVTFDTRTHLLTVYGGVLRLHGLRWKLPWRYSTRLGVKSTGKGWHPAFPGYSSYDGLYTTVTRTLSARESDWTVDAMVRVGTRFRLPATLTAKRETSAGTFTADLTRREDVVWDLRRRSRIDRLPEVSYARHLDDDGAGLSRLDLTAFGGHVREHVDGLPCIDQSRVGVQLDYTPYPQRHQSRQGWWWAASARQTLYTSGEQLSDLALEAGAGWKLGEALALSVSDRRHFPSGTSPFAFDRVWVEDELIGTLDTNPLRTWSLSATGRWDLEEEGLRDYTLQINRRMHCLTWNMSYSFGAQMVSVGLDLNGLTGGTPPPQAAPLVSPDEVPPLPPMVPGVGPTNSPFRFTQ